MACFLLNRGDASARNSRDSPKAVGLMIKRKTVMEKLAERFEALPDAWFENELFEQARDYMTRGRRFETMSDSQLNEKWAKTFRQFVRFHVGQHIAELADAGAELRLRGAEFPTHLVISEVEQLQSAIRFIEPVAPPAEFDSKFDDYFGLTKPGNRVHS